jgi:hypothetical protein
VVKPGTKRVQVLTELLIEAIPKPQKYARKCIASTLNNRKKVSLELGLQPQLKSGFLPCNCHFIKAPIVAGSAVTVLLYEHPIYAIFISILNTQLEILLVYSLHTKLHILSLRTQTKQPQVMTSTGLFFKGVFEPECIN